MRLKCNYVYTYSIFSFPFHYPVLTFISFPLFLLSSFPLFLLSSFFTFFKSLWMIALAFALALVDCWWRLGQLNWNYPLSVSHPLMKVWLALAVALAILLLLAVTLVLAVLLIMLLSLSFIRRYILSSRLLFIHQIFLFLLLILSFPLLSSALLSSALLSSALFAFFVYPLLRSTLPYTHLHHSLHTIVSFKSHIRRCVNLHVQA